MSVCESQSVNDATLVILSASLRWTFASFSKHPLAMIPAWWLLASISSNDIHLSSLRPFHMQSLVFVRNTCPATSVWLYYDFFFFLTTQTGIFIKNTHVFHFSLMYNSAWGSFFLFNENSLPFFINDNHHHNHNGKKNINIGNNNANNNITVIIIIASSNCIRLVVYVMCMFCIVVNLCEIWTCEKPWGVTLCGWLGQAFNK